MFAAGAQMRPQQHQVTSLIIEVHVNTVRRVSVVRVMWTGACAIGLLVLAACGGDRVTAPQSLAATKIESESFTQSHEVRILVDPDGKLLGIEPVRIRSKRANFVKKVESGAGKKLVGIPAKHQKMVTEILQKSPDAPVVFYEHARGYRPPKSTSSTATLRTARFLAVSFRSAVQEDEYWTQEQADAYVDDMAGAYAEIVNMELANEPDPDDTGEMIRLGALQGTALRVQLPTRAATLGVDSTAIDPASGASAILACFTEKSDVRVGRAGVVASGVVALLGLAAVAVAVPVAAAAFVPSMLIAGAVGFTGISYAGFSLHEAGRKLRYCYTGQEV